MKPEELEEFGFTNNEAKVYLELIKLGQSTASALTKSTKLHRTNIYDALERLTKNGMATFLIINGTKHFSPADPESLITLQKERELKLASIIPQLKILEQTNGSSSSKVHMFEGIKGMRTLIFDLLTCKEKIIRTYGNPPDITERVKFFINQYHTLRQENGIMHYHLYNEDVLDRIDLLNSMEHAYAGILPPEYSSPVTTSIYDNKIHFMVWSEVPMGILIENETMAETYKNYYRVLFEVAQKDPKNAGYAKNIQGNL